MAREKMTNQDAQSFLNMAYNKFFCKWRDNAPEITDSVGWNKVYSEAKALSKQYERFTDDNFDPCTMILWAFLMVLDDRKRGER